LPEGHLALFVNDLVDELDLSAILSTYETMERRGNLPYHPRMLIKLLIFGYCVGITSSRKIERATYQDLAFRYLSADQHPDHDSIAAFRQRHLAHLALLFVQILKLCQKAGLVSLGHVALDGTKILANASKHKAMSYERLQKIVGRCTLAARQKSERELAEEVARLLDVARRTDEAEDAEFGKGVRGDELPKDLINRQDRLAKIRAAKAELEAEAKERATAQAEAAKAKCDRREETERATGKKARGPAPKAPVDPSLAVPDPKAQRNFTDPQSRIMPTRGGFEQCYNAQAVVDEKNQIIIAAAVTDQPNDVRQLVPMATLACQSAGRAPVELSADAGYFSSNAVGDPALDEIALFVAVERHVHDRIPDPPSQPADTPSQEPASRVIDRMRDKLRSPEGQAAYKKRKAIIEPVFGQIKQGRGLRRFSVRGLGAVSAEWQLICLTHNILKLFRAAHAPV